MKHGNGNGGGIRPIILKGEDARAAAEAFSRSLKNEKALRMLREVCSKPALLKSDGGK